MDVECLAAEKADRLGIDYCPAGVQFGALAAYWFLLVTHSQTTGLCGGGVGVFSNSRLVSTLVTVRLSPLAWGRLPRRALNDWL